MSLILTMLLAPVATFHMPQGPSVELIEKSLIIRNDLANDTGQFNENKIPQNYFTCKEVKILHKIGCTNRKTLLDANRRDCRQNTRRTVRTRCPTHILPASLINQISHYQPEIWEALQQACKPPAWRVVRSAKIVWNSGRPVAADTLLQAWPFRNCWTFCDSCA